MLECLCTQGAVKKLYFGGGLLDHTEGVCCGVEAHEGIKGTKQGDERSEAQAKEGALGCVLGLVIFFVY